MIMVWSVIVQHDERLNLRESAVLVLRAWISLTAAKISSYGHRQEDRTFALSDAQPLFVSHKQLQKYDHWPHAADRTPSEGCKTPKNTKQNHFPYSTKTWVVTILQKFYTRSILHKDTKNSLETRVSYCRWDLCCNAALQVADVSHHPSR